MTTPRLAVLAALVAVSACDFTPALDIDLPEHEDRAVVQAVLASDSVATVRVSRSLDPFGNTSGSGRGVTPPGAVVTLFREGRAVEQLRLRSTPCDFSRDLETECGPFVGAVPLAAGATYTVRAQVPGLPAAEGTVTLPRRLSVAVERDPAVDGGPARFRIRLADPPGRGDAYGLALLDGPFRVRTRTCSATSTTCRDTTVLNARRTTLFRSSDPALLASARDLDLDDPLFRFAAATDASFDGRTWSPVISSSEYFHDGSHGGASTGLTVQVAGLSADLYRAYQLSAFGDQGENPFVESVNLPSNVTGGYGLVGAVTLTEVRFPHPAPTPTLHGRARASRLAGR